MRDRCLLVVEDSDEDFETVQDAARLCGLPHKILRATSGDECLRLLRSPTHGRHSMPLLVLLDLSTPNDDGREVLREIRSDRALKTLPLVVLSGSANPHDLEFCYDCGVNAYHVKPVDHALHIRVLQDIFHYWLGCVKLPGCTCNIPPFPRTNL